MLGSVLVRKGYVDRNPPFSEVVSPLLEGYCAISVR